MGFFRRLRGKIGILVEKEGFRGKIGVVRGGWLKIEGLVGKWGFHGSMVENWGFGGKLGFSWEYG